MSYQQIFEANKLTLNLEAIELNLSDEQVETVQLNIEVFMPIFESFICSNQELLSIKDQLDDYQNIVLNLAIVDDDYIQQLNKDHRSKDKVTDVLTFPLFDDLRLKDSVDYFIPELELGDIYICHSVCLRQASEFNISYADEFIHLLVHGALHILGYDHEISDNEELIMQAFEKEILDKIGRKKSAV